MTTFFDLSVDLSPVPGIGGFVYLRPVVWPPFRRRPLLLLQVALPLVVGLAGLCFLGGDFPRLEVLGCFRLLRLRLLPSPPVDRLPLVTLVSLVGHPVLSSLESLTVSVAVPRFSPLSL